MSHFIGALKEIFKSKTHSVDITCEEDVAKKRVDVKIEGIANYMFGQPFFNGLAELFGTENILWCVYGIPYEEETAEGALHIMVTEVTTFPEPAKLPTRLQHKD